MSRAYPTAADLRARLEACAQPAATLDALDLQTAVEGAIADWEQMTGFSPWLAPSGETETLRFRPLCRKIEFECGVVEVISVIADGRALSPNDYELEPRRAVREGKPFTVLAFLSYYEPSEVEIVARVGYTDSLDAKVFELILDGAGASLGATLGAASSAVQASEGGEIKSQSTGDTKIEFSTSSAAKTSAMKYEADVWQSRFERGARARRLAIIGLNH